MILDNELDRLLQLFVSNREERQRAERSLKALLRKEDDAAKALAELVKQRVKPS